MQLETPSEQNTWGDDLVDVEFNSESLGKPKMPTSIISLTGEPCVDATSLRSGIQICRASQSRIVVPLPQFIRAIRYPFREIFTANELREGDRGSTVMGEFAF